MKKAVAILMQMNTERPFNDFALLIFRVAIALQLVFAHGLKKIGIGVESVEIIPNPIGLPDSINQSFAVGANIIMPLFIIIGLFTRFATIPILCITLTGYFLVHRNDPIAMKDIPFMYSICFLYLLVTGAGKYSLDYYFFKKSSADAFQSNHSNS